MTRLIRIVGLAFAVLLPVGLIGRAIFLTPSVWVEPIGAHVFENPVHALPIASTAANQQDFLVTEKSGRVFYWPNPFGSTPQVVLDLRERTDSADLEDGLLSVALQKDASGLWLLAYYNLKDPKRVRLSKFKISDRATMIADPASEVPLLELQKVYSGHNGGHIQFGPDNMLWISVGEGHLSERNRSDELITKKTLFGSILRLNVVNQRTYAIPEDNPYRGNKLGIPEEVWVSGLRNPWRFSFLDRTHLLIGDVGHESFEELNLAEAGDHLGWPMAEGPYCYPSRLPPSECQSVPFRLPLASFSHAVMRSITGGLIYRGTAIPRLAGKYIFGDYLKGLMSLSLPSSADNKPANFASYFAANYALVFPKLPMWFGPQKGRTLLFVSFAEGEDKEIYAVSLNGGIFKIVPINWKIWIRAFFYQLLNFR